MQIDRVDAHPKKDEVDYTVFFFGDNTQYCNALIKG